jgi:sugar transferase (PEP-CTERM/EpsH1 system associated)
MQILFLTHRLPYPPDKGERIRAFHELRYLAERHEVDLFCFADSQTSAENKQALQDICRSIYVEVLKRPSRLLRAAGNFFTGEPLSFGFFHSRKFDAKVRQALCERNYDLIFVYCSSMGHAIPHPAPAPLVVDFVDADSQKFKQYAARSGSLRRWLYAREGRAVAAAEQSLGRMAAISFAVTEHDARELLASDPEGFRVEVVSNGVQVPDTPHLQDVDELRELKPFALFVGTMNYPPNSDAANYFAREILPLVRNTHPKLKFVIVGRDPDRQVQQLSNIPGVVVAGEVPDVFRYFRNADVSVAPFRISQGFHNKIAESLAVGTPVITTSRAMAGIGLSEREGLFVAETAERFAVEVSRVLTDSRLRRDLREGASSVRQRLSWDIPLSRMEELIVQIAAVKSARPSRELVVGH